EYVTTQVTFAEGRNAALNIRKSDLDHLKQKRANYHTNFVVTESLKKVISGLAKKVDVSDFVEAAEIAVGNAVGLKELEDEINTKTALLGAESLNLEFIYPRGRTPRRIDLSTLSCRCNL